MKDSAPWSKEVQNKYQVSCPAFCKTNYAQTLSRQCAYNVTFRRVRATTVAVQQQ